MIGAVRSAGVRPREASASPPFPRSYAAIYDPAALITEKQPGEGSGERSTKSRTKSAVQSLRAAPCPVTLRPGSPGFSGQGSPHCSPPASFLGLSCLPFFLFHRSRRLPDQSPFALRASACGCVPTRGQGQGRSPPQPAAATPY